VAGSLIITWLRRQRPESLSLKAIAEHLRGEQDMQNVAYRKVGDVVRRVLGVRTAKTGGLSLVYLTALQAEQLAKKYGVSMSQYAEVAALPATGTGALAAIAQPLVLNGGQAVGHLEGDTGE
jgi:hypothetical protein